MFADALSSLPQTEVTAANSTGVQTGSSRWGEYSMLGVDPQDGCTFWFTTEYNGATASLNWRTRIASFKFPTCTPIPTGGLTGTVTNASTSTPISGATVSLVDAANNTWNASSNASGVYQFVGIPATTYTVTGSATGYTANTFAGVSVSTGLTTTRNIPLTSTSADVSITKTDGVTTTVPGGSVTYTITASNAGPGNAPGSTVADTFPAGLTCAWTCGGAGGGTCAASGNGNISDATVNLPAGGSVTYTANCAIAASATGTLSNTATVAPAAGVTDPSPSNNSATDTDTLTPRANLAVTKTDGVTTATPGGSVTYTITASNAGQSDAPGSTVTDTFCRVAQLYLDLHGHGWRQLHGIGQRQYHRHREPASGWQCDLHRELQH